MERLIEWSEQGHEVFDPIEHEEPPETAKQKFWEYIHKKDEQLKEKRIRLSPAELGVELIKAYSRFLESTYYTKSSLPVQEIERFMRYISADRRTSEGLIAGWSGEFALLASFFENGLTVHRSTDKEDLEHGTDLWIKLGDEKNSIVPIQSKVLPITSEGSKSNKILYRIDRGQNPRDIISLVTGPEMIGEKTKEVFEDGKTYYRKIYDSVDRMIKYAGKYSKVNQFVLAVLPNGFISDEPIFHSLTGEPTKSMLDKVGEVLEQDFGVEP